jgi:hypothetical protein
MPEAARVRIAGPRAGAAPRSALGIASGMRPSGERDFLQVSEIETVVKTKVAAAVTLFRSSYAGLTRVSIPSFRRAIALRRRLQRL